MTAYTGECRVINWLPGVYHIETLGCVYVTLLVGNERALLVDTALGICDLRGLVSRLCSLPLTVVNSHGHSDHVGGNYQFEEAYLHPADEAVAQVAMLREIKERVLAIHAPVNVDTARYLAYDLTNIRRLADGAVFDLGGLHVRTVPLPSHTPGSVGFLATERGLLLTADSIAPFSSLLFPEASSRAQHIALLRKTKKLPFGYMLTSHSERLIPKSELQLYLRCAERYDVSRTVRYHDPYFPHYVGRLFQYADEAAPDNVAFLVCPPADRTMEGEHS